MKRIWQKRKLILFVGVVVLFSIFFIGISTPVVHGQTRIVGGLILTPEGYFMADNGIFGGPGDHTSNYQPGPKYVPADYHPEPGCTNCIGGYWTKIDVYCCDQNGCWVCDYYFLWTCTLNRLGIMGNFTPDSACKAAYGGNARGNVGYSGYIYKVGIDICDFVSTKAYRVDCSVNVSPPALPAPPLVSSCVKWKNGICEKINTSLFQGGKKGLGDISVNPAQFVLIFFTIMLSFIGGIAILLIISAGYKIITSNGKPEGIQQGRDQLISAIIGLVFIIFSFVIFQLVVVDIFKIPDIIK